MMVIEWDHNTPRIQFGHLKSWGRSKSSSRMAY